MIAKADGFTKFIFGEIADTVYGGLDGLLSKEWSVGDFLERYSYVRPHKVLRRLMILMEPFLNIAVDGVIDPHAFLNRWFLPESLGSYPECRGAEENSHAAPDERVDVRLGGTDARGVYSALHRRHEGRSKVDGLLPRAIS